ncbi:MAG TPA: penicillin-binding protein 2 [Patescibacteria group bacterium]|nr:penicillin-binding protein 2 [Patescibacteria group bacterium]
MNLKIRTKNSFAVFGPTSPGQNTYRVDKTFFEQAYDFVDFGEQKNNLSDSSIQTSSDRNFLRFWLIFLLLGVLLLFGRSTYLQVIRGTYFKAVAEGNRLRLKDIKANRGIFYDRSGKVMAENISSYSLAIIPVDLPKGENEQREISRQISKITGLAEEEIYSKIIQQSNFSYEPEVILENLNQDQAIMTKVLNSQYPGVILKIQNARNYLTTQTSESLTHVLGYVGKIEESQKQTYLEKNYSIDDYLGKTGLELFYEKELKGVNGREQVEVDATGQAKEMIASQKPINGQNLVLTLDLALQQKAEESLRQVLSGYGKKKGAVVILDPNSGEVLALVSWPSFDNNVFSRGLSNEEYQKLINDQNNPLFSRAMSGEYPSGSTFKLVIGAAALQEGIINENTSFNSVGGISVSNWFFPDWKAGGHGWTNIYKALAESVNTFFYIIGGGYSNFEGLGVAKIKEYAQNFGLNQKLGIDLPNEASGFLPSQDWKEKTKNEQWYIGDTYHLSIGQGDILVTPLQVAAWTSVFASGGKLFQPHLVKEILDSDNQLVKEIEPKIINQNFIEKNYLKIINHGLRQAVLTGSARGLGNLPISVAAKTGTAEWSSQKSPHAWLTAFAPYENPRIVVTVLVEEGGEGSSVALPVAREIINWWAQNRNLEND